MLVLRRIGVDNLISILQREPRVSILFRHCVSVPVLKGILSHPRSYHSFTRNPQ
jgi:hypothetical protein